MDGGGARSIFAAGNEDLTPLPEACVGAGMAGDCTEKRAAMFVEMELEIYVCFLRELPGSDSGGGRLGGGICS
jgi:hypothetical protein